MRAARRRSILLLTLGALLPAAAAEAAPAHHPGFVLTTTQPGGNGFAPAFVGNGYLAGRQPADGQGFALVPVRGQRPAASHPVRGAGLLRDGAARRPRRLTAAAPVERRAALPGLVDARATTTAAAASRSASGHVDAYRQTLDLRTGTLTTEVTWTSPAGRTAA